MDDTKLHTNIIRQMRNFLEIVLKFSNNIIMNFGLDECKTIILKGKLTLSEDITLSNEDTIKVLDIWDQYKYLGMFKSIEKDRKEVRKKYQEKFFNHVTKIFQMSLNSNTTIQATNKCTGSSISKGLQSSWLVNDWTETYRPTNKKCIA